MIRSTVATYFDRSVLCFLCVLRTFIYSLFLYVLLLFCTCCRWRIKIYVTLRYSHVGIILTLCKESYLKLLIGSTYCITGHLYTVEYLSDRPLCLPRFSTRKTLGVFITHKRKTSALTRQICGYFS